MVLLDSLYWEYWYDPQQTATNPEDRNILYENRLLGVPRMRQVGCTAPLKKKKSFYKKQNTFSKIEFKDCCGAYTNILVKILT